MGSGGRSAAFVVAAILAASALGACSSHGHADARTTAVRLRNFAIDMPATVPAGTTTFALKSDGPTMHEFNVVRTDLDARSLPLAGNGVVDDQSPHPGFDHLGEREGIDMGQRGTLKLALRPGHYVVYCNMEGHYLAGMSAAFTVSS